LKALFNFSYNALFSFTKPVIPFWIGGLLSIFTRHGFGKSVEVWQSYRCAFLNLRIDYDGYFNIVHCIK
jgi:hypothetical protein